MSVMDWDEGVVNGFVVSVLKQEQYEDQIYGTLGVSLRWLLLSRFSIMEDIASRKSRRPKGKGA